MIIALWKYNNSNKYSSSIYRPNILNTNKSKNKIMYIHKIITEISSQFNSPVRNINFNYTKIIKIHKFNNSKTLITNNSKSLVNKYYIRNNN